MISATQTHEKWLNVVKCVAIIAVMIDHTSGILYSNAHVTTISYCSVTLFVMSMGISSFWSYVATKEALGKKVLKRIIGVIVPYFVSVCIIYAVFFHRIDLREIIDYTIHFNIVGPHYYICLYLQLMIASPVLFFLINRNWGKRRFAPFCYYVILSIMILAICFVTTNYSSVYEVMAGGGLLFGGTYLFVLYWGMLIGALYEKIVCFLNKRNVFWVVLMIVSVFLCVIWWRFVCINQLNLDGYFPFGMGKNPPSISLFIGAFLTVITIFAIVKWFDEKNKVCKFVIGVLDYFGAHTLYVFLYHSAILEFFRRIPFPNIWIARICYFGAMILMPILLELIMKKAKKIVVSAYEYHS